MLSSWFICMHEWVSCPVFNLKTTRRSVCIINLLTMTGVDGFIQKWAVTIVTTHQCLDIETETCSLFCRWHFQINSFLWKFTFFYSNFAEVCHDDVIKWKHFPRNWPFVRGVHRSPVNSPHKGQWRGALMFSLICVWINDWVNNREAGDLRRYRAHYDVIVMVPMDSTDSMPLLVQIMAWHQTEPMTV